MRPFRYPNPCLVPARRAGTARAPTEHYTSPANSVYVSHISFFEIAIKQMIGKLPQPSAPVSKLISLALGDNLIILPIAEKHLAAYERIPLLPDHRDPFDRLLLATALAEGMPIVSTDKQFSQYASLVTVIAG